MSTSKALLHGDGLLRALTETALEVQRARFVSELLTAAGSGLEKLGLEVAIISMDEGGYWIRYLSPRGYLTALKSALVPIIRHEGFHSIPQVELFEFGS